MAADFRKHPSTIKATLVEDFIITARSTKQPYIRVKFDDLYNPSDTSKCPLALVPTNFWIYPLLKDAVVTLMTPNESPASYVLYSVDFDLPDDLLNDVTLPTDGSLVTFGNVPATLAVTYFSEDFWIIAMDGATLVHAGKVLTFYRDNKVVSYTPSDGSYSILSGAFMLEAKGKLEILASAGFDLSSSGAMAMTSNNVTLKEIISAILDFISDLYSRMASFDSHTHPESLTVSIPVTSPAGTPSGGTASGTSSPTTSPTGAAGKSAEVATTKSTKSDIFFQEN